jgi:hypothetical protein
MQPFTNADIVKEYMLQFANTLFENKKETIETFNHILISLSTKTKNTEVFISDNQKLLKQELCTAGFCSSALDESCDITDTAQLIIYVKYLKNTTEKFYEDFLTLLLLLGTTINKIMKSVMSIVHFIRAKSLIQHRQFKSRLWEFDSQFDDLLFHNNVRWLSKGNVLNRFFN